MSIRLIFEIVENNYKYKKLKSYADLNRMIFHNSMSFDIRMKNLCRLTYKEEMVKIMSNEYAIVSGESEELIFRTLWKMTTDFQNQYFIKRRLKKKLKFWKK